MSIDVAAEIEKAMKEQLDLANEVVDKAVDKVTKETINELKSSSPRKSGHYAEGWATKEGKTATRSKSAVVWNEKHYRLTHLLEHGHAKVDGGRVAARPHIGAAEQKAIKSFEDELRRGIEHG